MSRFFFFTRLARHGAGVQKAFPLLLAAFIVPSDRRREYASPIVFSSIKSLAGFTSFIIPQVPLPDTSKLKDKLLGGLPSWTTKSATSRFVKRPQADIVVGLSLDMNNGHAFVAYYKDDDEIIARMSDPDEPDEDQWIELRSPHLEIIDDWPDGKRSGQEFFAPLPRYTSTHPHKLVGRGYDSKDTRRSLRWVPDRPYFYVDIEEFFSCQDEILQNLGSNKPVSFDLTQQQVMTDLLRTVREHIETFISRKIVNKALIVNDSPVIKWVVMYPDVLDGTFTEPGVSIKRDLIRAFKNAGYPIQESDIPKQTYTNKEDLLELCYLDELGTEDHMVEFISVGYASVAALAKERSSKPHLFNVPYEQPFAAAIDDETFFSSRVYALTNDTRFGVLQQSICAVGRSPVFKSMQAEHMRLIGRKVAVDFGLDPVYIDYAETHNELHPEVRREIEECLISNWPESETWTDVIDLLNKKLDKPSVDMITSPAASRYARGESRKISIDSPQFALFVQQSLVLKTLSIFAQLDIAPHMTDVLLFTNASDEADAYQAILESFYIRKDYRNSDTSSSAPGETATDETTLPENKTTVIQSTDEYPETVKPGLAIDGIDWEKMISLAMSEQMPPSAPDFVKRAFNANREELTKVLKELKSHFSASYNTDLSKYNRLRALRPEIESAPELGLLRIVQEEVGRIFVVSLRT
ncbi:hypothetical protein TWF694_000754 [Orbilia ellipsospora]|uniref:Uncharacterized protein n=1 Tax=Orbilia ellipsospora TaxID=2528407 RepID=A0AAV9XRA9_9PEZI